MQLISSEAVKANDPKTSELLPFKTGSCCCGSMPNGKLIALQDGEKVYLELQLKTNFTLQLPRPDEGSVILIMDGRYPNSIS